MSEMPQMPWRKFPEVSRPYRIRVESHDKDGNTVGWAIGMSDYEVTYLTDLFVLEDHRKQGHGARLVKKFLNAAQGTSVVVLTQQYEFYKRFGFVERTALIRRPTCE